MKRRILFFGLSFITVFISSLHSQTLILFPQVLEMDEDQSIDIDPFLDVYNTTGFLDYSISGVTDVDDGFASFGGAPPMVTYTPNLNFNGTENIIVTGCVNSGAICNDAEIVININPVPDDPIAANDSAVTYHVTPVNFNILENDIDIDGYGFDVTVINDGLHGTAVYLGDSLMQYVPEFGFLGWDTVTYRICDAGEVDFCDQANVYIEVLTNNFNKPAAQPDFVTCYNDSTITIHPLENDFDGDADNLLLSELILDGAFGDANIISPTELEYNSPETGIDSFLYVVCDYNTPQYCDTTYIKVTVNEKPVVVPDIHVPDSFSPNGDNFNDYLNIIGLDAYPSFRLRIFNRWNDLVYENDDPEKKWNGRANTGIMAIDKDVPEGTYFYILELQGKADPLRGYIVLKR